MSAMTTTLKEINDHFWEYEFQNPDKPYGLTEQDLTYAAKIFSSALMNVMWVNKGDKDLTHMLGLVEHVGSSIRELVKQSCGVDLHETIKKYL